MGGSVALQKVTHGNGGLAHELENEGRLKVADLPFPLFAELGASLHLPHEATHS